MANSQSSTTVLNPTITSADVADYNTRLQNILGGNALSSNLSPSSISSSLYPTTPKPAAPVTPIYPTPDGKPIPTATPAPAPTGAPAVAPTGGTYKVVAGDSLSKIAAKNGMTLSQLLALNPDYKANPNLVQIGASINLGGSAAPVNNGSAPTGSPTGTPTGGTPNAPVQTDQQKADALAAAAGKAGLSVSEYQAILDRGITVSKEESDKIKQDLGIPALETAVFAKPSKTSEQLFTEAYATSGLADLKTKIAALDDQIAKERGLLSDATGAINENPFLTETSRVGRGKRVLDQAEQKINNLIAQKTSYTDLYTNGIKEINDSILRQQNDFKLSNDMSVAQLNYLVAKADKEVAMLKDKKTTASNNSLKAYLDSVASGKAPTTIGNSESGFYKYDQTTGKFIQVIAPSALSQAQTEKAKADAANGGDSGAFKPTADQKALVGRFANSTEGAALGFTAADKARLYTDPNFFYWALQKASEAGFY